MKTPIRLPGEGQPTTTKPAFITAPSWVTTAAGLLVFAILGVPGYVPGLAEVLPEAWGGPLYAAAGFIAAFIGISHPGLRKR